MSMRGMFLSRVVCICGLFVLLPGGARVSAVPPNPDPSSVGGRSSPRELGSIAWIRGFDAAAKKARSERKPLLVLFQEVPGCGTCVNYGEQVLSHPLIVEAAETYFVPVAVYNNIKGEDERTLKSFQEPAWNNPVVRIVTHDRKPLAKRVADDYSVGGLAAAMVEAMEKGNRDVPTYLRLLAEETAARRRGLKRATFAMHCFWEGEGALGEVPGVIATMPGFLNKKEVVEVEFDPARISYASLVKKAKALQCASQVFARDGKQQEQARKLVGSAVVRTDEAIRPDKQPKYYLSQTAYRFVPMTALQAARVNAAIGRKHDPKPLLSPRQIKLLETIEKNRAAKWPDAIGAANLPYAWRAAVKIARSLERKPGQ